MESAEELRQFKADIFATLAHPTRIAILEALSNCELSGEQLSELLELTPQCVAQNLTVLRSKNLVSGRKEDACVVYHLRDKAIADVLTSLRALFQRQKRSNTTRPIKAAGRILTNRDPAERPRTSKLAS